jgi:hypothetical protein
MALTEEDLRRIEAHVEHAQRAAAVLDKVREVHLESAALRDENTKMVSVLVDLRRLLGQAGEIIRAIDGIYKSPGVTVQRNYEDFLQPELRQLHDRFMRGII